MATFTMVTDQSPAGDQAEAIAQLTDGLRRGDRHQTLLGVTGSGKSVAGGTPVLLKQGRRIFLESIGTFVDRLVNQNASRVRCAGDTEILEMVDAPDPIEAFSFDSHTGSTSWKPVRQLLRHRSPGTLWQLRTACGRAVTATGDHNFFV